MSCFVIGDIHGCVDELARLLSHLPLRQGDRVVFLGDYIDRGPHSREVISQLLELESAGKQETVFLKGNHEDMLLGYLGLGGGHGDMFLYNGGQATLSSYGVSNAGASAEQIAAHFPASHLRFLADLKSFYTVGSFCCVHAGVRPFKPLSEQDESDLLWIRSEFILNPHRLPFTVLFGHTPQSEVLFDLPYKVGLDTGLVYGNKLSCLEVEEKTLYQINRGSKSVRQLSLKNKWKQGSLSLAP
jgi:serine/threonine protein phosphatase 1